jgi:hypothetical protein
VLRELGFSRVSVRPKHPDQVSDTIVDFKKRFCAKLSETLKGLSSDTAVEIWFQDEMRISQWINARAQWTSARYRWWRAGARLIGR